MNKRTASGLKFANLPSNLSLHPISLNATNDNKAKNNRKIEYLV